MPGAPGAPRWAILLFCQLQRADFVFRNFPFFFLLYKKVGLVLAVFSPFLPGECWGEETTPFPSTVSLIPEQLPLGLSSLSQTFCSCHNDKSLTLSSQSSALFCHIFCCLPDISGVVDPFPSFSYFSGFVMLRWSCWFIYFTMSLSIPHPNVAITSHFLLIKYFWLGNKYLEVPISYFTFPFQAYAILCCTQWSPQPFLKRSMKVMFVHIRTEFGNKRLLLPCFTLRKLKNRTIKRSEDFSQTTFLIRWRMFITLVMRVFICIRYHKSSS